MFTGLVQDLGTVEAVEAGADGARLRIATSLAPQIGEGDSVAVDGICLTATAITGAGFQAEAMNRTLEVTALRRVEAGSRVNLELAMRASDRLGGHIVQGHVDGVGTVLESRDDGFARRVRVELGEDLLRYAVDRGSIALSGVSLTVAGLGEGWVEVSLIPETLERTNLGGLEAASIVNVECDIVAKYVERLLAPAAGKERA